MASSTGWIVPVVGLVLAYLIITKTGLLNQLTSALKSGGGGGGPPASSSSSGKTAATPAPSKSTGGSAKNPDQGKGTPGWYLIQKMDQNLTRASPLRC